MKIIVGCECSGVVRRAFRARGHDAWSCDLIPATDGGEHIQRSILEVINDGWDMGIFHPPCTYLTMTANRWLKDQPPRKSGKLVGAERRIAREDAIKFFLALWNAPIEKMAVENPIGCMSRILGRPHQIIHPYYFGDPVSKATCLWLRNLPPLEWTHDATLFLEKTTAKPEVYTSKSGKKYDKWSMIDACKIRNLEERSAFRSVTFLGFASAMAEQWG